MESQELKTNIPDLDSLAQKFTGRQQELEQIQKALSDGPARAIVITGPGGVGKSALALMAANGLRKRFDYIYRIDCRGGLGAEEMLLDLGSFFKAQGVGDFDNVVRSPMPLNLKLEFMGQILRKLKILLLFENCEFLLSPTEEPSAIADTSMSSGLASFITQSDEGVRFMVTSRRSIAFGSSVQEDFIKHIPLQERPDAQDVEGVIATAYDALPDDARSVLAAVAVFQKPFPLGAEGMEGDIDTHVASLEEQGLLERMGKAIRVPLYVRDFLRQRVEPEKWRAFLIRAAQSLETHAQRSQALWHMVNARMLYLEAGIREQAGEIALKITEALRYLGLLEQAVAMNRETADTTDGITRAAALHNLGSLLSAQGNDKEALEHYHQSLTLKQSLGLQAEAAFTLGQIGNLHYQRGDIESARRSYEDCLELSEGSGEGASAAAAMHQLALIEKASGNLDEAMKKFTQSLELSRAAGNRQGEAASLTQIGSLHQSRGDLEQAQEHLGQGLSLYEELRDEHGIARARTMLGNLAYQARQYDKALGQYEQSLKLRGKLHDSQGVASTLLNMGMAHQGLGDLDQALEKYTQSAEVFEELKNIHGQADALHQCGSVHLDKGDLDQALEQSSSALGLRQKAGDHLGTAQSLAQMGIIHMEGENYSKAVKSLVMSLAIFEDLNSPIRNLVMEDLKRVEERMDPEEFKRLFEETIAALKELRG